MRGHESRILKVAGCGWCAWQSAHRGDVGPNPTDRGKPGTKRIVLADEQGGPLAAVIAGAKVDDTKLLDATLAAVVIDRSAATDQEQQHCLDKGHDNLTGHAAVAKKDYVSHIRCIGKDATARKHKKSKPHRWVVERTLGCRTASPC